MLSQGETPKSFSFKDRGQDSLINAWERVGTIRCKWKFGSLLTFNTACSSSFLYSFHGVPTPSWGLKFKAFWELLGSNSFKIHIRKQPHLRYGSKVAPLADAGLHTNQFIWCVLSWTWRFSKKIQHTFPAHFISAELSLWGALISTWVGLSQIVQQCNDASSSSSVY